MNINFLHSLVDRARDTDCQDRGAQLLQPGGRLRCAVLAVGFAVGHEDNDFGHTWARLGLQRRNGLIEGFAHEGETLTEFKAADGIYHLAFGARLSELDLVLHVGVEENDTHSRGPLSDVEGSDDGLQELQLMLPVVGADRGGGIKDEEDLSRRFSAFWRKTGSN